MKVIPEPTTEPPGDTFGPELLVHLDWELSRLPERYRPEPEE